MLVRCTRVPELQLLVTHAQLSILGLAIPGFTPSIRPQIVNPTPGGSVFAGDDPWDNDLPPQQLDGPIAVGSHKKSAMGFVTKCISGLVENCRNAGTLRAVSPALFITST